MFKYFARLHEKHGLPVYPVALLTYDAPHSPEPDEYALSFPNRRVLEFRFHAVQLNRLNWRDYLNSKNPLSSALMAKMHIEPRDRWRVKAQCLRLLVTFKLDPARTRLISGFIDTYLRLNREEYEQFNALLATELQPDEQEKIMELTTSWKEEGILQGMQIDMQKGMEQGMQQGEALTLIRLLRRRFGEIPVGVEQAIAQASLEQIDHWLDRVLDAPTLDAVFETH